MSPPPTPARPVAVLDTSVLVPTWSRLALQRLADGAAPAYRPVWSEWILAETWRVLTWRWAARGLDRDALAASANAMLRRLLRVMTLVSLGGHLDSGIDAPLADPDDLPVWATAVLARAQYVVSDNIHDFPPPVEERAVVEGREGIVRRHRYQGIEYLTAVEFIEDVLGEDPAVLLGRALPSRGVVRSRRGIRFP